MPTMDHRMWIIDDFLGTPYRSFIARLKSFNGHRTIQFVAASREKGGVNLSEGQLPAKLFPDLRSGRKNLIYDCHLWRRFPTQLVQRFFLRDKILFAARGFHLFSRMDLSGGTCRGIFAEDVLSMWSLVGGKLQFFPSSFANGKI